MPVSDLITTPVTELLDQALEIAIPAEPIVTRGGISPLSKYCGEIHAQLNRLKFLGFSDGECARAVGIAPLTLKKWRTRYPKLSADMDRALELSKTRAAIRLHEIMDGDGASAFRAIKFFLSTHSESFKVRQELVVNTDPDELAKRIRADIYGLPTPAVADGEEGGIKCAHALPGAEEVLEGDFAVMGERDEQDTPRHGGNGDGEETDQASQENQEGQDASTEWDGLSTPLTIADIIGAKEKIESGQEGLGKTEVQGLQADEQRHEEPPDSEVGNEPEAN